MLSYSIWLHCFYLKKTVLVFNSNSSIVKVSLLSVRDNRGSLHSKLRLYPIKWFYSSCRNPELCISQELFVTQQLGGEEDSYSKSKRNFIQDAQITLSKGYG